MVVVVIALVSSTRSIGSSILSNSLTVSSVLGALVTSETTTTSAEVVVDAATGELLFDSLVTWLVVETVEAWIVDCCWTVALLCDVSISLIPIVV